MKSRPLKRDNSGDTEDRLIAPPMNACTTVALQRNCITADDEESKLRRIGFSYSRFSTDKQRDLSIEAQQAVCDDLAASLGLAIPPENRYFDRAKSGKSGVKRPGWEDLLRRIEHGDVRYLFADEQSRLFRGEIEVHQFKALVVKHEMTVLARDVDTRVPGWEFMFSIRGAVNALELITTRGRIKRTLVETVKRGHAWSRPGFGYKLIKHFRASGEKDYSEIAVDKEAAEVVRRIFADRRRGLTFDRIAEWLNAEGVKAPGSDRGAPSTWHGGSVAHLVQRAIYKGVYQVGKVIVTRPEWQIVDSDEWEAVQSRRKRRGKTIRGGGSSWLGGLCFCVCGCIMGIKQRGRSVAGDYIGCARCCRRRTLAGTRWRRRPTTGHTFSTGESHLRAAIEMGFAAWLTDARIEEIREELKRRGSLSNESRIDALRKRIDQCSALIARLARSLARLGDDDLEEIENAICRARDERMQLRLELGRLEAGSGSITKAVVEKQLVNSPRDVIRRLFDDSLPVYEVRVMLSRIFPAIVYEGRTPEWWKSSVSRDTPRLQIGHLFLMTLDVGALLSAFTRTPVVEMEQVQLRVMVTQVFRRAEFTAQLLEAPVTNAPELPIPGAERGGAYLARSVNRLEQRTDVERQKFWTSAAARSQTSNYERQQQHFDLGRAVKVSSPKSEK